MRRWRVWLRGCGCISCRGRGGEPVRARQRGGGQGRHQKSAEPARAGGDRRTAPVPVRPRVSWSVWNWSVCVYQMQLQLLPNCYNGVCISANTLLMGHLILHRAQYIGEPKTSEFRQLLDEWQASGIVRKWAGNFMECTPHVSAQDSTKSKSLKLAPVKSSSRYVGYPSMNSICKSLASHPNIQQKYSCKVSAEAISGGDSDGSAAWKLTNSQTGESCGEFDWLVCADRSVSNGSTRLSYTPMITNYYQY